jgi:carboxymethylenebutenolidase
MTAQDLNDMQRYLVEEEAEKWQQGRITRRELLRRAALIVGGAAAASTVLISLGCDVNAPETVPTAVPTDTPGATAAATAPSSGQPTAQAGGSPYHVPEGDPSVTAQMVEIPSADGSAKLKAYMASPAVPGAGMAKPAGVLVVHENRGLTEYIKDVVRRLGKARYTALAVDLVSRQGGSDAHPDEAERTGILGNMPPDQIVSDLGAGLDYLKSQGGASPDRLGVVGFCFGGGYTWRLATKRPDLKAAVPFYGPNPPLEDVPNIKAAVLAFYGGKDTRITSGEPQIEDAMKKAGITYEVKIYPDANHAFHNDTGANYNPDAASDAWEKTLAWFGKYL